MKIEELRIGNLVEWFHPENGFVKCKVDIDILNIMSSEYFEHSDTEIYPIALTDEWLLKFKNDDYDFYRQSDGSLSLADEHEEGCTNYLGSCKYVHQLQNLFYCLTGEELKYTE